MARRPGDEGAAFNLSPRALRIGGWIVAVLLIAGIAIVVGLLGGDADAPAVGASPSGSAADAAGTEIDFGTALDPDTGEVAEDSRTDRFAAGDTFVYSVAPDAGTSPPQAVYVEVRRTGGGTVEIAQAPAQAQRLPNADVIAFTVPADDLLAVFGPGDYLMLIYEDPEADPIAEGTFVLVGASESPSLSASPSP